MLAHESLDGQGHPQRWMYFLHGILGRRQNWRAFARRWLEARAESGDTGWGAVLIDLRLHGESRVRASDSAPPPHTVRAAAQDVVDLAAETGRPIDGICGHSFGAKVALRSVFADVERPHTRELWVLDAPVGEAEHRLRSSTMQVFDALAGLPQDFSDRKSFVALVEEAGISRGVAQWLATNLEPGDGGRFRFPLDIVAIRSMLVDYAGDDLRFELSSMLESAPLEGPGSLRAGVVLGGRSDAVDSADKDFYQSLADAGHLSLRSLERAGHWIHVDDAAGLLSAMATAPELL